MMIRATFLLASASLALSIVGLNSAAFAGEGGVAGAASFRIDATTSKVTGAAVAGAVGKSSAYAGANNYGGISNNLDAFAVGTGGTINVGQGTSLPNVYVSTIQPEAETLGNPQANTLQSHTVNANAISGQLNVTPQAPQP